MSIFTYTDKNKADALQINNGNKFTEGMTLKYHDINAIVELLLKLKDKITTKRNKQLAIMEEHLKGSLYSYTPFHFTMYNGLDLGNRVNEEGFFFDIGEKELYVDVDISPEILVDIRKNYYSNSEYYAIILYFIESTNLRNSTNRIDREFPYTIHFYIDQEKTKLFGSISGLIEYKYKK